MTHAAITGIAGFVPDYVLTNKELETLVDTNDEWISSRTGIRERRILKDPDKATSFMGTEIVNDLLFKTSTDPSEIDLLICCTITPDMSFPDTANTICHKAGLINSFGFDINAACSGFLYGLYTASQFVKLGTYKKVIVVGVDKMSSIIDYEDRSTCIIFGDGGGGVLLEPDNSGNGIIDAVLRGDGSGSLYLHMKAGGALRPPSIETVANREHYVFQDGRPVFKAAVQGMKEATFTLLHKNDLSVADIDWLVPHQANIRIINTLSQMIDFPREKVMVNIHKYGNTTAGTIPLCLWDWEDKLQKGDKLILTAFGGGFTWGSLYLKWAYSK